MISEELFRKLDEQAQEIPGLKHIFLITKDIVDYFTDIARVTDCVEMGGFLLGKLWINHSIIYAFHDYVQVRNVSPEPETSYTPDPTSKREVMRLFKEGRYDIGAIMHTHPDDSAFSSPDLVSARFAELFDFDALNRKFGRWLEEMRPGRAASPGFLVTGGAEPTLYCYTYNTRFELVAVADDHVVKRLSGYLVSEARSHYEVLMREAEIVVEKMRRMGLIPPDLGALHETIMDTWFVGIPLRELEWLLSPEVEVKTEGGGSEEESRELIEELKERMKREIERRLRGL